MCGFATVGAWYGACWLRTGAGDCASGWSRRGPPATLRFVGARARSRSGCGSGFTALLETLQRTGSLLIGWRV
jgi:hypothetical protein